MEQNIKINYTEAAKQKIDELNKKYIQDLEYFLKETKYVPGEDFIEVTASDINELAKYIKIIYPRTKVFEIRNFLLKTYFVLGILTIFCGLFYSEIQNIILYKTYTSCYYPYRCYYDGSRFFNITVFQEKRSKNGRR